MEEWFHEKYSFKDLRIQIGERLILKQINHVATKVNKNNAMLTKLREANKRTLYL